jgi:hypothetical protein
LNSKTLNSQLKIELQHLPLTFYFSLLKEHKKVWIEAHENFQKQTLRNRTFILTANKVQTLSVPVAHGATLIRDITIDYTQSWLRDHLRAMTSAYKHAPYFEYCFPYFEAIYEKKPAFLFDLNWELLQLCLKTMRLEVEIAFTPSFDEPQGLANDFRSTYEDKKKADVAFASQPYRQVFGTSFESNLSIIDLIFNHGPEGATYL